MYHHPGEYVTDFCIIQREEEYHLFHIRGERWTWPVGYRELDLGHAVSTDLRLWQPREPVLPAGPAGAWDECGNWAPDMIEVDGVYYCYYTGSDINNNQAIGLATSADLYNWEKHPHNPVVAPGPWSDRHVGRDVAGRDAMVFADAAYARYLLYYTATMSDGRACIGLSESTDLLHWRDLGPTYIEEDRTYNRLESAYLVQRGARYYLFYSAKGGPKSKGFASDAYPHFDIVYQIGESPLGPWRKPANHELLTEWTCASEHPTFDGVTYMFYIVQEEIEGIWGASVLSDPKQIAWQADGTVQVHEHVPDNVRREALFDGADGDFAGWVAHSGDWEWRDDVLSANSADDTYYINTLWGIDLCWQAELRLADGAVGSLLVRANPLAMAGYRIGLDAARGVIGLYQMIPGQKERVLQERPAEIGDGTWHTLKVVAQGAFFDIYLGGVLQIVRHHRTYADGCFGLHACGGVQLRNLHAYRQIGPEGAPDDWQRRCLPRHLFANSL